jgi:hypothetical protein
MLALLLGLLLVAATATAADWVWYTFGVRHGLIAGVIHGAVVLTVLGGVLGAAAGRTARGLPIGTAAGVAGAATYFLHAALFGGRAYGTAVGLAWVVTWLALAALEGRLLRVPARRSWGEIALRGSAAALLGGVAFYLVMDTLWGAPPAQGRNYALQFAAWVCAWAPGLLALTVGSRSGSRANVA